MEKIKEESLDEISGGNTTVSGPIINAVTTIIELIKDAGYAVGSGIRRISENSLCPLK